MELSICLATYNGVAFLREQLDSVVAQMGPGDELLVSDDGSTDETVSILREYADVVKLVAMSRAGGVVSNFERVISTASKAGVVLCDQDDVWQPGRLDAIRSALSTSRFAILDGSVVDKNCQPVGKTIFELVRFRPGFLNNLIRNSYVGCCMAFKRSALDFLLPFPRNLPWHDWYIALVCELLGPPAVVHGNWLLFRRHGSNNSPTGMKGYSFSRKLVMRVRIISAVILVLSRILRLKVIR